MKQNSFKIKSTSLVDFNDQDQRDQIGLFLKLFVTNFVLKVAKIFVTFLA